MGNEEERKKELDYLLQNYQKHFDFSYSLEKGINAYNLTVDYLKPEVIIQIRRVLELISDQFSDDFDQEQKDARMEEVKTIIRDIRSKLTEKEDMEAVYNIFRSLMDVAPKPLPELGERRITPHRC